MEEVLKPNTREEIELLFRLTKLNPAIGDVLLANTDYAFLEKANAIDIKERLYYPAYKELSADQLSLILFIHNFAAWHKTTIVVNNVRFVFIRLMDAIKNGDTHYLGIPIFCETVLVKRTIQL